MITLPGYEVFEKYHESDRSVIYRARCRSNQVPVLLKMLRQEYPSPRVLARFRREYDILRSLNLVGVLQTYGMETCQQSPVLVLEDFGGKSLHDWLQQQSFNLDAFLTLALKITSTLGEIHQHNLLHKDINPSNIVLNPATGQVKIIDFGIATVMTQEMPTLGNFQALEGTLAYMSPEQTGRMNRAIDYRTDFYALGVTFYQWLCDRLPFETTDPLELVHCHIARQPIPPEEVSPAIPRPLSDLVMKLLAKNAEDRYQSAYGICADLQNCLDQLRQYQTIDPFPVGSRDISIQFQIPQKLYGREREVGDLLRAIEHFAEHSQGKGETQEVLESAKSGLILVSGDPGIGKTRLVQELYKPITRQNGFFIIAGKFDQLHRPIPYSALIQAFQNLIQQLLTKTEEQIQHWRQQLLAALGESGQVLIDVIPDVELLLGPQPEVPELSAAASENRFHWALEKFIQVLTPSSISSPLVLFLDDLHWADPSSLQLIQQWITNFSPQQLLVIGTYRSNEVTPDHPLMHWVEEIRHSGGTIHSIALSPLGLAEINNLIQDAFYCDSDRSQPLAELVLQKTHGNPFFIHEFLRFLYQEKLICLNSVEGRWDWSVPQIQAARLADNVGELVTDRIQELPIHCQHTLSLAACIGNQFDLQTLAIVSECSPSQIAINLQIAIQHSLVAPIGDDHHYLDALQCDDGLQNFHSQPLADLSPDPLRFALPSFTYKFLHDRIQQTAYGLIPEQDKPNYHLKIGQLLRQSIPDPELEDRIFEVIDHLNSGASLLTELEQKRDLAQLNWMAGRKAQTAIAYHSALNYLNRGRSLLPENSWKTDHDLTLELCESTAKAAYLSGDFEQMEQRVEEVLRHANTALEKTKVYWVKIQACIAQGQFSEAIQIALQALDLLGIQLSFQPKPEQVIEGIHQTKQLLIGKQMEDLLHLPRMTDPYKQAAMGTIASVCTPTYFLAPDLWKLMVLQKIQLSVTFGNARGSAFGYADYGMILCGMEGDIATGCQFSHLAETLQPQLNAREFVPKTALLLNTYLKPLQVHLKETLEPLQAAYQCGLETGDLEYATFAIAFRFYHAYLLGQNLHQLEQEMGEYEGAITQFKQALPLNFTQIYRQGILNLLGQSQDPCCLKGSSFDETIRLPQLITANDRYILFHFYLNRFILCYLFQDFAQAATYGDTLEQLIAEGAIGLLVVPIFYFYDSLTQLAIFSQVSSAAQSTILEKVSANQRKMQHWADHAPMNYQHKVDLVAAEQHRILGQDLEAADAYDRAIDLAREHEYLNEEALANELAGRFYLSRGKPKIAQSYLLDARYSYQRWGAMAKVDALEHRYPQIFDRLVERHLAVNPSSASPPTSSTTSHSLDWVALMKASQVLSGEIRLDKLLAKLMAIVMEHGGAQRGCLLLDTGGNLQIEAESHGELECPIVLQSVSLDSDQAGDRVPLAIVHYVMRTQQSLVLNQVSQDYRFNQDAYICTHQPKSILCTPLIHQGKLSGILYLENNLITDAFSPDRLEILQFLSTQAAISLDNARLYNQLELRVQERTAQLMDTNTRLQQEILERQRSEEILRLMVEGTASVVSENFFRSLVRSLAQALQVRYALISGCIGTPPTRVRTFAFWQDDNFEDNFEYDLVGTPCDRVITEKGCQLYAANVQSLFPEDGALMDWRAESYLGIALLDSAGEVLGHLAVLDDKPMVDECRNQVILEIFAARAAAEMERKQSEEALRISEAKFSTAFRSSPDAITISTLNDGCYIEVNDSCQGMFGYSQEEMIGRSAIELGIWAKPDDRTVIRQLLQHQGNVSNLEVKFRRKSGEVFPALLSAGVIRLENEPCLLMVAVDLTKLKRAEKALEQLAEIGEFAAMIVHEVRNPLTTISMGLNAFKRLSLTERFQEYLALSLDEADRLQRLLNQILLYSRPTTLQRSQLDLTALIASALNTLKDNPITTGRHLKLIALSEPAIVLADSDQLKQVFINLVTNACEAVDEGETITIQLQRLDPHQIYLQIHNGGDPIPADILPKLTRPFFTTKASGTGLGLAIVKRIVEAHNGEFSIESSTSTGTLVRVKLPLHNAKLPN